MSLDAVNGPVHGNVETASKKPLDRVLEIAIHVLKMIGDFLRMPLRYFGAKNWSIPGVILRTPIIIFKRVFYGEEISFSKFFPNSYDHSIGNELNRAELKEYVRYASYGLIPFRYEEDWIKAYNAKIVNPHDLGVDASKIKGNVTLTDKAILDRDNLFKVVVVEDQNELVVTFGSMHSHWMDFSHAEAQSMGNKQLGSIAANFAGASPLAYEQASAIVEQLKLEAEKRNKKLVLTGQSLGGSFAAFAGIMHQVKTIAINAVQLGAGLQQKLGDNKLNEASQYVDHVTVEGELLNMSFLKIGDIALSLLGIRTPGNFGRRHKISSFSNSMRDSHDYPIKSFLKNMGYKDEKTRSCDFKDDDIVKSGAYV